MGSLVVEPQSHLSKDDPIFGDKYIHVRDLAETQYGKICVVRNSDSQELCAKIAYREKLEQYPVHAKIENPKYEVAALRSLHDHPAVIELLDCIETDRVTILIMPLLPGDLMSVIEKGPLSEAETKVISQQILSVLLALQEHGLAYVDLSPENVGIREYGSATEPDKWKIALIDFGSVTPVDLHQNLDAFTARFGVNIAPGKLDYQAPEVGAYSSAIKRGNPELSVPWNPLEVQVWSFGVILFLMATGARPYNKIGDRLYQDLLSGFWLRPNRYVKRWWDDLSMPLKTLIDKLVKLPQHRLTFNRLAKESWFVESEVLPIP